MVLITISGTAVEAGDLFCAYLPAWSSLDSERPALEPSLGAEGRVWGPQLFTFGCGPAVIGCSPTVGSAWLGSPSLEPRLERVGFW